MGGSELLDKALGQGFKALAALGDEHHGGGHGGANIIGSSYSRFDPRERVDGEMRILIEEVGGKLGEAEAVRDEVDDGGGGVVHKLVHSLAAVTGRSATAASSLPVIR